MSASLRGGFGRTAGAKQPCISEVGREDGDLPENNLAKFATKSATNGGRSTGPQRQETDNTLIGSQGKYGWRRSTIIRM